MRRFSLPALGCVFALALLLALPAQAVTCQTWTRLDANRKAATINQMINQVLQSQVALQYSVSRERVARCLQRYTDRIWDDFDDTCADPRSAGMSALDNVFNKYIWSCVR